MRLNDEKEQAARRELEQEKIRKIVQEEIVKAFQALARSADGLDIPYETGELESSALYAIGKAAEGAVQRLTCKHEYRFGQTKCWLCDEPEPVPDNPFKEK